MRSAEQRRQEGAYSHGTFSLSNTISISAPAQFRDAALWWAGISAGSLGFDPDPYVMMDTRPEWARDAAHLTRLPEAPEDKRGRALGAQAQLWSEHLEDQRRIDYAAFPRLAAFSEIVWTARDRRNASDLLRRVSGPHDDRLEAMGIERRPADGPHPWQQKPHIPGWYRDRERESAVTGWVGGAAYFDWHEIDPNNPPEELLKIRAEQPDTQDGA